MRILCVLAIVTACGGGSTATPDAGGNHAPAIADLALTTAEDTPISGTVLASDADGDALAFSFGTPTHGTIAAQGAIVTYTPAANYHGSDTFTVTAKDQLVGTTANVDVTITAVNDPPVAVADSLAGTEDTPLVVPTSMLLGNDTDLDGDVLSVTAVDNPTHGTVVLDTTTITFTPAANFNGVATFDYVVGDGIATSNGHVTITFGAVNDAPVAVDDTATTPEDVALVITSATLVANDTDADGNTLTVTAVGNATNGTVALASNTITFTPATNFNGAATFDYTISDGTLTDTGTVAVTVSPVDDAPVAVDDTATTAEDTAIDLAIATLVANDTDIDGDVLTITAVANATHGTVAINGANVTFTPAANYNGPATFDYTVSDGTLTDTGTVGITVTAVEDAPVAVDDTRTVQSDVTSTIPNAALLANDTDADGDVLSITAVGNPVHGTATLVGANITFAPDAGYTGAAAFDYTVSDGTLTDVGTVAITVTASPVCGDGIVSAPETCDDANTTSGDGCSGACAKEAGWDCAGAPSACTPHCGDHVKVGNEPCDDGNTNEFDGCTSQCKVGVSTCKVGTHPSGSRFAIDPATGHCYIEFAANTTYADAETACVGDGGYLAVITSAAEQSVVAGIQGTDTPWIGATDDANDTDDVFVWVTGAPFAYKNFAPGEPDDDASIDGNGECLHATAGGPWGDTNCNIATFVVGRVCEIEPAACGDHVVEGTEECDDGNLVAGDGCSATCKIEPLVGFSFAGSTGDDVTFPADLVLPAIASAPVISRAVVTPASAAGFFSAKAWPASATIDTTAYFTFTVTPASGKTLTLSRLELDEQRSLSGIRNWSVRSSVDGFATDLATFAVADDNVLRTGETTTFGAAFAAITTPVEIRIYAWASESSIGTWRVDNIHLFGLAH